MKNSRVSRNTRKQIFLLVSGRLICALETDTKTWRLHRKLDLGKTFFRVYYTDLTLGKLFVYLSSFIFQILGFLYLRLSCIFDGVTVKTTNKVKGFSPHTRYAGGRIA